MITIAPGSTVTRDVAVYSDATQATELNITGATVAFSIYDAPNGTLVTDLTASVAVIDAPTGKIQFTIDCPSDYGFHVFWYAVKLTESDGTITVVDSNKLVTGAV